MHPLASLLSTHTPLLQGLTPSWGNCSITVTTLSASCTMYVNNACTNPVRFCWYCQHHSQLHSCAVLLNITGLQTLLAFSEEQICDTMHLRQIYVSRRGLHAMERREMLSRAPVSHHQMPLPSDNLTQLSDLASQLKKNAADDYRVYHRIACALRRGVSCLVTCSTFAFACWCACTNKLWRDQFCVARCGPVATFQAQLTSALMLLVCCRRLHTRL